MSVGCWHPIFRVARLVLLAGAIAFGIALAAAGDLLAAFWVLFFTGLIVARPIFEFATRSRKAANGGTQNQALRVQYVEVILITVFFAAAGIAMLLGLIGRSKSNGLLAIAAAGAGVWTVLSVRRTLKEKQEKAQERPTGDNTR